MNGHYGYDVPPSMTTPSIESVVIEWAGSSKTVSLEPKIESPAAQRRPGTRTGLTLLFYGEERNKLAARHDLILHWRRIILASKKWSSHCTPLRASKRENSSWSD